MPCEARKRSIWRPLAGALGAFALCAGAAGASIDTRSSADDVPASQVGRYCTPQGCSGSLESALGNAAGFGAAAFAAALLSRRRSA